MTEYCKPLLALFGVLFVAATLSDSIAQENDLDRLAALQRKSAGERIVIAGRQRMLAEGMAAKLCFKMSGVSDAAASRELYTMWNVFGWYHAGLRNGNPQLDLAAERNLDVLRSWSQMDMVWGGLRGLYEEVLDNGHTDPLTFLTAIDLTGTVTDAATDTVAALRSAYSDQLGPRGFGRALLIDLYERQRMLGQKIAKEVCLLSHGAAAASTVKDLSGTLEIFTLSMGAFETGMEDVGVPPPLSPRIAAGLAEARAEWTPVARFAKAAAAGQPPSKADLARFASAMDRYIAAMTGTINSLTALTSE